MKNWNKRILFLGAVIGLALSAGAQTNVLYVDFGFSGNTYADVSDQYNGFASLTSKILVDRTGTTTGITLKFENYGTTYAGFNTHGFHDAIPGISADLLKDVRKSSTGSFANVGEFGFTLTLSGLDLDGTYTVAAIPDASGFESTWKVAAGTGDATEYIQSATATNSYFKWNNLSSDINGEIVISGRANSNAKWKAVGLAGLVIEVLPLPAKLEIVDSDHRNSVLNARRLNKSYEYELQMSTELDPEGWQPVGDPAFGMDSGSWSRLTDESHAFFRLKGLPIDPAGESDLTRIPREYFEYQFRQPSDEDAVALYLESQLSDGTWADVDYAHTAGGGWLTLFHLKRILPMAVAYASPDSAYYQDPAIKAAVLSGVQHWLDNDYRNSNWWHTSISIPEYLLKTFVFMGDEVPDAMLTQAMEGPLSRIYAMNQTGQNLVWVAGNHFWRAYLNGDESAMNVAAERILSVLDVAQVGEEGLQQDWTFHQHGPMMQSGAYGVDFGIDMVEWSALLKGSGLTSEKFSYIRNYLLEGSSWMIWKGRLDLNACGRQFTETADLLNPNEKGQTYQNLLRQMSQIDSQYAEEYEKRLLPQNELVGHKSFWRSDLAIHRRPEWYASLKMSSTRVVGTEIANQENTKGLHWGDGTLLLYQSGQEYVAIPPLWDWHRLPGTTADMGFHDLAPNGYATEYGATDFVGGLTVGDHGFSAMHFQRDELTAYKAWFFGENSVICLGAGIGGTSLGSVYTSVQQSLLIGPVESSIGPLSAGTHTLPAGAWVHHDGYGYQLADIATLDIAAVTGNWDTIYSTQGDKPAAGDVFSIWVDHGPSPSQESYAYVIHTEVEASEMAQRVSAPQATILSNTKTLQAIDVDGATQAIFYAPGQLSTSGGRVIAVDSPCLLSLNANELIIADPSQILTSLTVTIAGTSILVELPSAENAGKQVVIQW